MMHSCQCNMCNVTGSPLDVMRHERFDHGHYFPFGRLDEAPPASRSPPSNLTPLESLKLPNELVELLSTTEECTHVHRSQVLPLVLNTGEVHMVREIVRLADLNFPRHDVKIAIDHYFVGEVDLIAGIGFYSVTCQVSPNTAPLELLMLGVKQNRNETLEASQAVFMNVICALGLTATSPAQFLAAIMASAIPFQQIKKEIMGRSTRNGNNTCELAITRKAFEIWADAAEKDDEESSLDEDDMFARFLGGFGE